MSHCQHIRFCAVWLVLALLSAPLATLATPLPAGVIVLEDEQGDEDGPGTYRLPRGSAFHRGSFDLARVRLTPKGSMVEIAVELHGRAPVARGERAARDAIRDVLLLQVDLYIDTDRVEGSGFTEVFPGRRVQIDPADAWERAVVITALPGRVASSLAHTAPELASHITVVPPLRVEQRQVVAQVPASALGGPPSPEWGYTVLATSVTLASSLKGVLLGPGDDPNIYTRAVTAIPGTCDTWQEEADGSPCTFGGCDPCGGHPRVLDAIVGGPAGSRAQLQRYSANRPAVLRAYVPALGGAARPVAEVVEAPPVPRDQPLSCEGGGRFPVQDADGDYVTFAVALRQQLDAIDPGRIGELLAEDGAVVGRAVVVRRMGTVVTLERIMPPDPGTPEPKSVTFRCADGTVLR
jgi:hypothetical protein